MNFDSDEIEESDSLVLAVERNEYQSKPKILVFDTKHQESSPTRPSIVDAQDF